VVAATKAARARGSAAASLVRAPVRLWASVGVLILTFEAVVLIRWVSGPYLKRVPAGPTAEPGWMRAVENVWQGAGVAATLLCFYLCLVRPWRRERALTTDGLLVVALATLWFEDPMCNYFGQWFTYNSNLINFGSWVKDVPGWQSYGRPGAMLVEPIVLILCVYVYFVLLGAVIGCGVMRWAKRRWPRLGAGELLAICFVTMCAMDVVAEGLIILPLGFWEYPGGVGLLFPSTYHKFPVNEMLTLAATFTAISALRYFRDDRGLTLVERGVERLRHGPRARTAMRLLAIVAAVHLSVIVFYVAPNLGSGARSRPWPAALQKRSYLTDGVCGVGTRRACPGSAHPTH
jgi:Spirocyclase AveC-like